MRRIAEYEFDCAECGRHIFVLGDDQPRTFCAECVTWPGWFRDPELRARLDPSHDGRERMDVAG